MKHRKNDDKLSEHCFNEKSLIPQLIISQMFKFQIHKQIMLQTFSDSEGLFGAIQVLRNVFSGYWTPTHPLVTLITLNLTLS